MKTRQYIQPRFLGSRKKIEIEYFSSGQINYFKFLRFCFCFFRIKHLSKFKAKKVRFFELNK